MNPDADAIESWKRQRKTLKELKRDWKSMSPAERQAHFAKERAKRKARLSSNPTRANADGRAP